MLVLINLCLSFAFAAAKCYEPSLVHPLPDYDANHPILKTAFVHLDALLTIAIKSPEYANTSFSVDVTSSERSLWSYHHTARERNASRPDIPHVNGEALYRIASITKSFTVLALLQQHAAGNLSLDDPVDKYIAELQGKQKGSIPWKDITLRSLASQLSGIPREFAQGDFINVPSFLGSKPEDIGLPPVSHQGLPHCSQYSPEHTPCTREDLIDTITARNPVFAPNQKSSYSNVAFELLGLVLSNVTNQTYESHINDAIFAPLDMSKSTFEKPPDSAGVIPLEPHYYDADEGIQNPTGGIYSSANDLSKYLRYILARYNGITHATNWIHPVSPGEGLYSFYGMPWEIYHTDRILLNSRRVVKFITKGGGLPGYSSIIMTLPDYGLAITLLVGGPPDFFPKLQEIVTVEVVRAAEQYAIAQLQQRYAGTFIAPDPELNSSITLVADHRGLVVERFISNSTDMLPLAKLLGMQGEGPGYVSLVPTLLYHDEEASSGELWRLTATAYRSEGERDIWDDFCITNIDPVMYAGLPLNEFAIWGGEDGIAYDLGLTGFRANLTRIIKDDKTTPYNKEEILEL